MSLSHASAAVRIAILLGCAAAASNVRAVDAPAQRVVLHDPLYSVVYAGRTEPAQRYFRARGFEQIDTRALLTWIEAHLAAGTCPGTVVLQLSDVTPKALVLPWDTTSPLFRYCAAGGRYVSPGGNTLYRFEGETDITITQQGQGTPEDHRYLTKCFGVHFVYGLRGKGKTLTDEGSRWGLANNGWTRYLQTGVPLADITHAFVQSEDGVAALAWIKTVNAKHPGSGLIGMTVTLNDVEPLLESIYRLCTFNGIAPVAVPPVEWRNDGAKPPVAVVFSMRFGAIERRAFQRGEEIPLQLTVTGDAYNGDHVSVRLTQNGTVLWTAERAPGNHQALTLFETIPTAPWRCGEYSLEAVVGKREPVRERIWICARRKQNAFPFFLCKSRRLNPHREELALKYVRGHYLNVNIFNMHQMANADTRPEQARQLGTYLDLLLRQNLLANARAMAMPHYTTEENGDEQLILYDGRPLKHGQRYALGFRAIRDGHLPAYRETLGRMSSLLRRSASPAIVPIFWSNDDGSMAGYYDFNKKTLASFTAATGLARDALPPLKNAENMSPRMSRNTFMPDVPEGVIPDDHPWLRYVRYHAGNYAAVSRAGMEGLQSGWPGALMGDIGCMSGPLYVARGYYPPIYQAPMNLASFYQYNFWFHHYSFAIAAVRMGNRDKPLSVLTSAAYTAWGGAFQRGVLYHILSEAPQCVGFWSLDARQDHLYQLEEESYDALREVATKVAPVAEFLQQARVPRARIALLLDLAQLCFNATDRHQTTEFMRTSLGNIQRAGARVDLIASEEVLRGDAARYDLIIVCGHHWMMAGVKAALEAYVKNGGTVVCDGATTIPIEGAERADDAFGTNVGTYAAPKAMAACQAAISRYRTMGTVTSPTPDTLVHVNRVGDLPLAWVLDIESTAEARALQAAQSKDWTYGVPNYLREREAAEPRVRKAISVAPGYWAYDLWQSQEIALRAGAGGRRDGDVQTAFYGAVPIALYRDQIDALRVLRKVSSVTCGDTLRLAFELESPRRTPVRGLVPASVKVTGPDGSEAWEHGGNVLIEDGLLTVALRIARNDPPGAWRLTVRELCSGRRAETAFTVRK
ncbi:MAG: hypothetical protein HN380_06985 [Victivallales bacterium]|nr:hypothetical protein [Victivallales bacterium]